MKKLTCKLCGNPWYADNDNLSSLTVCPYCAESLHKQVPLAIQRCDTLEQALFLAIQHAGEEILNNPRKLVGLMTDLAPTLQKEIRIFSKSISDGYAHYLVEAYSAPPADVVMKLNNLKRLLIDEEGLSENWAESLIQSIQGAIQLSHGVTAPLSNVIIEDYILAAEPLQLVQSGSPSVSVVESKINPSLEISWDKIIDDAYFHDYKPEDFKAAFIADALNRKLPGDNYYSKDNRIVTLVIPDGTKAIPSRAFEFCKQLKLVRFSCDVTSIGSYCFRYCERLKSVTLPPAITQIVDYTFAECKKLESVKMYSNVTRIAQSAFENCENLSQVFIPANVRSIGGNAFRRCWKLHHVYYEGTEEQWKLIAIGSGNDNLKNATIHFSYRGV